VGARVELPASPSVSATLFGEGPGGFLVSGSPRALEALAERLAVSVIGTVGGEALSIELPQAVVVAITLEELAQAHSGGLLEYFP
jgi:phosphoribosylformylglycinamidine synthase subunit PurL